MANIIVSGDVGSLFAALAKAQAEMGGAVKGDKNPFFKSKYANLTSVLKVVGKPLADHGLSVIQMPGWDHGANQPTLTTMLCHEGGGCIQSTASAPFAKGKTGPQEYGSVTTYLRRYSLQAMLAVPTVDDDAEASQMVVRQEEAEKKAAEKKANGTNGTRKRVRKPKIAEYAEDSTMETMETMETGAVIDLTDSTMPEEELSLFEGLKAKIKAATTQKALRTLGGEIGKALNSKPSPVTAVERKALQDLYGHQLDTVERSR